MSTPWVSLFYDNDKIVGISGERYDGSLIAEKAQEMFTEVKDCKNIQEVMEQVNLNKWLLIGNFEIHAVLGQVDFALAIHFDELHDLRLTYLLHTNNDSLTTIFSCNCEDWDKHWQMYANDLN